MADTTALPIVEAERRLLRPAYRFEVTAASARLPGARGGFRLLQPPGSGARRDAMPADVSAWLHIGEDGRVSVFTGKAEVGQNIRTSLSQVVAEELRVPIPSITMVMADTAVTPFDMGTFGSRTTPIMAPQLRKVAAAAREMLVDLAAQLERRSGRGGQAAGRIWQRAGTAACAGPEAQKRSGTTPHRPLSAGRSPASRCRR